MNKEIEVVEYKTPSGIPVKILQMTKYGWYWMDNGAIIDQEILNKWKIKETEK